MRVFRSLEQLPAYQNSIITIGTFDGVHQGHQKIIQRLKELAKQEQGESVIITFHPHPRLVINPQDNSLQLLNTIEEKVALLERYGVHNVVVVPFSRSFSEMDATAYVRDFLVKNFHPRAIVIGYDHKFGNNRSGDFVLLEKLQPQFGYQLEEITQQTLDDIAISSTKIREALYQGETTAANELLGHRYTLSGVVVKGLQNGRKLGYPTANIQVSDAHKLIPKTGVYAVNVRVRSKEFGGLLSIGFNPTFEGKEKTIEVNILDFHEEIYGETISLELVAYTRGEKKFGNTETLIAEMDNDKKVITKILQQADESHY